MLNKQLGLGELFAIYQTIVFTYNDFADDQGETIRPFRFSEEKSMTYDSLKTALKKPRRARLAVHKYFLERSVKY